MAAGDDKTVKAPDETKAAPALAPEPPARYRILSGGVAGVGGVTLHYDTTVTAAQIGDQARIDKLIARGSIRVADAAEQ